MKNKELQNYLAQYPDDMPIKIMIDHNSKELFDLTDENILHSSETAYCDADAPMDEWDSEDGKIELGNGKQYLLFNPIIY